MIQQGYTHQDTSRAMIAMVWPIEIDDLATFRMVILLAGASPVEGVDIFSTL